jgi:hypothetical protein
LSSGEDIEFMGAMDGFKDCCILDTMDASIFGRCKPFLFHQAKMLVTISMVCRSIILSLSQNLPLRQTACPTNKKNLPECEP